MGLRVDFCLFIKIFHCSFFSRWNFFGFGVFCFVLVLGLGFFWFLVFGVFFIWFLVGGVWGGRIFMLSLVFDVWFFLNSGQICTRK